MALKGGYPMKGEGRCHCSVKKRQCSKPGCYWMRKGARVGWFCIAHAGLASTLGWKPVKGPVKENAKLSARGRTELARYMLHNTEAHGLPKYEGGPVEEWIYLAAMSDGRILQRRKVRWAPSKFDEKGQVKDYGWKLFKILKDRTPAGIQKGIESRDKLVAESKGRWVKENPCSGKKHSKWHYIHKAMGNPIRPVEGAKYRYDPIGWDVADPHPFGYKPIEPGSIFTVTGGVGGRWGHGATKGTLKFVFVRDLEGNMQSVDPKSLHREADWRRRKQEEFRKLQSQENPSGKNLMGKMRKLDQPYEVWKSADGTWEWRVLKKWQADDRKPYARWFCAVRSPFTQGSWEYGDVYAAGVMQQARRVDRSAETAALEEYKRTHPGSPPVENPRTVSTREEMKEQSFGALNIGGDVTLWLMKGAQSYYFVEDDGDLTRIRGASPSEAVAAAKKLWPRARFFPNTATRGAVRYDRANPPEEYPGEGNLFKVGELVEVVHHPAYRGSKGKVIRVSGGKYLVSMDQGGKPVLFAEDDLDLVAGNPPEKSWIDAEVP